MECFHIQEIGWNAGRGGVQASHVPLEERSSLGIKGVHAPVRCMNEWHKPFRRSIERIEIADGLARWSVWPNGMELALKHCQFSSRSQVCQSASR
jgi:isochorismate hydrolase